MLRVAVLFAGRVRPQVEVAGDEVVTREPDRGAVSDADVALELSGRPRARDAAAEVQDHTTAGRPERRVGEGADLLGRLADVVASRRRRPLVARFTIGRLDHAVAAHRAVAPAVLPVAARRRARRVAGLPVRGLHHAVAAGRAVRATARPDRPRRPIAGLPVAGLHHAVTAGGAVRAAARADRARRAIAGLSVPGLQHPVTARGAVRATARTDRARGAIAG